MQDFGVTCAEIGYVLDCQQLVTVEGLLAIIKLHQKHEYINFLFNYYLKKGNIIKAKNSRQRKK